MKINTPKTIVFIRSVKINRLYVQKSPKVPKQTKKHKVSCLPIFSLTLNLSSKFSIGHKSKIDSRRAE